MQHHRKSRKSHPSAVEGLIEDVICGRYKRKDEVKEPVSIIHVSWLRLRLAAFVYQENGSIDSHGFPRRTFLDSLCGQLF